MATTTFIKKYIFDNYNGVKNCKVIKKNNKYIGKVTKTNPKFNKEDYQCYIYSKQVESQDFAFVSFAYAFILFITGLLCGIPHVIGALSFTIINIIIVTLFVRGFNIYDKIIWIIIAVCLFLITIFIAHFILTANVVDSHYAKDTVEAYKAFHTIYPEYLFKFKFK